MSKEPQKQNSRPQIFSDQLYAELGEDLINHLTEQIYQGLASNTPQKPTSLCYELLLEEIDECLLLNLVDCTLHNLNPLLLTQEILQMLKTHPHCSEQLFPTRTLTEGIHPGDFELKFIVLNEVLQSIDKLTSLLCNSFNLRSALYDEILLHPVELPPDHPKDLAIVVQHTVFTHFRNLLAAEYDNFAMKVCRKVACIQSDMEFLAAQIKQITINYPTAEQGIIEIVDASTMVAQSFFSEEEDFAKIFKAVKAVSAMVEDLAHIYQEKLDQLSHILSLSAEGCPVPIEDHFTLSKIPTILKEV